MIREALTWLATPFHHAARLKGAGVDCANFLCAVYERSHVLPHIDLPYYPRDWMLHKNEEVFLKTVLEHMFPAFAPEKGDLILYKYGRCASHGAIYLGDNRIIHALAEDKKVQIDSRERFKDRLVGCFTPWRIEP